MDIEIKRHPLADRFAALARRKVPSLRVFFHWDWFGEIITVGLRVGRGRSAKRHAVRFRIGARTLPPRFVGRAIKCFVRGRHKGSA
jgi:hypothetical protein